MRQTITYKQVLKWNKIVKIQKHTHATTYRHQLSRQQLMPIKNGGGAGEGGKDSGNLATKSSVYK